MGLRIREDNGGGRAVPEPPLRGRLVEQLNVTGDGEGRPCGRWGKGEGMGVATRGAPMWREVGVGLFYVGGLLS